MRSLLAYLTEDCCGGRPEICGFSACGPAAAPSRTTKDNRRRLAPAQEEARHERDAPQGCLQCSLPLHRQLGAQHHGGVPAQPVGTGALPRLQRRQPPEGARPSRSPSSCCSGSTLPTGELRSKDWDEFARPGAPALDFVFTVCDQAAGEVCPIWPGQPITAHWGLPDPAAFEGSEAEQRVLFGEVFRQIENRIKIFCALPIERLTRLAISAWRSAGWGRRPRNPPPSSSRS